MTILSFPLNFVWGAAASAYQIEGAVDEDGRGPSIWDGFCHQRGRIHNDDNADVAADHYHRWKEDIGLMRKIGLKAYRFSISWSRIFPEGWGRLNEKGLEFYERLVDALLAANIIPIATLYHFDLPQVLQDQGGWPVRETARRFGDYARTVGERLGDRVPIWLTHNEPVVSAFPGYFFGNHAPGRRYRVRATLKTLHHILLSHGYAVQALRDTARNAQIGVALNLSPIYPARPEKQRDVAIAQFRHSLMNRITLDPLLKGTYPPDLSTYLRVPMWGVIKPDDLTVINQPLDFVGVNYYHRWVFRWFPFVGRSVRPKDSDYTEMWEIYPKGLFQLLKSLHSEYPQTRWFVTENGAPFPDAEPVEGVVHDPQRIEYLRNHLLELYHSIQSGVPVMGYLVWSLLDNFEWEHGYSKRFGLVHVDFKNNETRTIKDSGHWFAEVIRHNGVQ